MISRASYQYVSHFSSSAEFESASDIVDATTAPRHSTMHSNNTQSPGDSTTNIQQSLQSPTSTSLRTERDHLSRGSNFEHPTRYGMVSHNTTDTQTASPTVAPPTRGDGLVPLHHTTTPEEIRRRALMPSNSQSCRSGASPPRVWTVMRTSALPLRTRGGTKIYSHIKILEVGNKTRRPHS